ncbi:cobalamin binding intrinsic factor-like [Mustelus asterias]
MVNNAQVLGVQITNNLSWSLNANAIINVSYVAETEQCMTPDNQQTSILRSIKRKLSDRLANPHPGAFIALRLGIDHDLQLERTCLRWLSEIAVRKVTTGESFPIDLMAFYILAFRSSCWNAAKISARNKEVNLVAMLRKSLYRGIHEGSTMPYSNETTRYSLKTFNEVSLAILALCQEQEYIHSFVIHNFARVHLRKIAQHGGEFTVDTMATAALTLRCLINSQQPRGRSRLEIGKALMRIIKWILSKVREDGTIGTLSTTGLAMQALTENINVQTSRAYNCSKSLQKMVHEFSQGNLENLRTVSQVAIALGGKSYLDVNSVGCPTYKVQ